MNCKYNEDTVILKIKTGEIPFNATWNPFDNYQIPQNLRPSTHITAPNFVYPDYLYLAVNCDDGKIYRVSRNGNTVRTSAFGVFTWTY